MEFEEAIKKYERLIYYTMNKYKVHGFDIEDMVNIGRYNLSVCCKTFDESKGYTFTTYLVKSLQNECHKMYIYSQRTKRAKDSDAKSLQDCCKGTLTYEDVLEEKDLGNIDLCKHDLYQMTNRLPQNDREIMVKFLEHKFDDCTYTIKDFCRDYHISYVKLRRILDDYRAVISVEWGL